MVELLDSPQQGMTCDDVHQYVDVYIDGEFDSPERREFEVHLSACGRCQRAVEDERRFRDELRARFLPVQAPSHLQSSVLSALDRAEIGHVSRWSALGNTAMSFAPVAVAAAIVAAVVWPFGPTTQAQDEPAFQPTSLNRDAPPPMVVGSVSSQPAWGVYARVSQLSADVANNAGGELQQFLRRAPFAARQPFEESGELRLQGARSVQWDGAPAVLYFYRYGKEPVLVVQRPSLQGDPYQPTVMRKQSVTQGIFRQQGLTNILLSEVSLLTANHILQAQPQ